MEAILEIKGEGLSVSISIEDRTDQCGDRRAMCSNEYLRKRVGDLHPAGPF